MRSLVPVLLLALVSTLSAQLEPNVPEELLTSLTARVNGFYNDFREGQFRRAEDYVDEQSKDVYYNVRKTRIMGHEIKTITWADDFRSARVMVTALTLVPLMGSKPLPVPVGAEWNLIDGEWYMHMTAPEERRATPFGNVDPSASTSGAASGLPQNGAAAPSPQSFRRLVTLSESSVAFPTETEQPMERVITVKSQAPAGLELALAPLRTPPPALKVRLEPENVPAGGEAKLSITYDPTEGRMSGRRRLDFEVDPTGQRLRVTVVFETPQADESAAQ